jgi:hypothetical protein
MRIVLVAPPFSAHQSTDRGVARVILFVVPGCGFGSGD